jgi:glycosyltransferase involved in cell wall biosynthesis
MALTEASETPVAIYLPTYNRAAGLDRAIRSALAQTHPRVHVYVSDNASPDDTPAVCQRYAADPRFSCTRFPENQGPQKNFETLYRCSDEPWMMFLADDDAIDKDYVEKCLAFAASHDCIRVGGAAVNYVDGIETFRDVPFALKHDDPLLRLFCYSCIPNTNAVFYGVHRRTELAFDPRIPGNDVGYTFRQIFDGKVAVIGTTHIHRDVTHWTAATAGAMPAAWLGYLKASGYTDAMIGSYDTRYSILDRVDQYFEALRGRCADDALRVFLYLMFCVEWRRRARSVVPRPRLHDFVRDAARDAGQSGFSGTERFHELEEWLNDQNTRGRPAGPAKKAEAGGATARGRASGSGRVQAWHTLWSAATRLYDQGSREGGLQDGDLRFPEEALRRSCLSRAQRWRERLHCCGAKLRSVPLVGRWWARRRGG